MARQAPLRLHRRVLVDKRPPRFRVALRADRILVRRRLHVVIPKRAVNVMAVAALHKPLIYLVMERRGKCRLDICVALIAKQGLGYLK